MQFEVGPFTYTVRICAEPLFDDNGRELLGLAVLEDRAILLSHRLKPQSRLNAMLHELLHAWEFHFPAPRGEEERASMFAAVTASALRDLKKQGGEARLMAMMPRAAEELVGCGAGDAKTQAMLEGGELEGGEECGEVWEQEAGPRYVPLDVVESWQSDARPSAGRCQCGVCETVVQAGMVENDPPAWSWAAGGLVMKRRFFCPHCGDLQEWTEGSRATGTPTGAVVDGPVRITDSSEVERFLRKFPAATGLIAE